MDGTAAIEFNRQALKRILASIIAMACLSATQIIPRRLYLAALRLLRPAESATRRLIIAMARGLTVPLPPRRPHNATPRIKVLPILVRNGVGTGIVLPPGAPVPASLAHLIAPAATRQLAFPLTDAPRRWRGRCQRQLATNIPRIGIAGSIERPIIPVRTPHAPDDPIEASRLGQRLELLGRALDDLAAQARRFARWQALRDRSPRRALVRHPSPLRPGRPPGGRLSRYDPFAARSSNIREVDAILAHAHALAVYALERPDTS